MNTYRVTIALDVEAQDDAEAVRKAQEIARVESGEVVSIEDEDWNEVA